MATQTEDRDFYPLPPELKEVIGGVAICCGQIEHILGLTIRRTTGVPYDEAFETVETLRNSKDVRKRVRRNFREYAIREFGTEEGSNRADSFDHLIRRWVDLEKLRGLVIHSCWTRGKDGRLSATHQGQVLMTDSREPLALSDVVKLRETLERVVLQLTWATREDAVRGPEEHLAAIPKDYTLTFPMYQGIEVSSTAAAIFTPSDWPATLPADEET